MFSFLFSKKPESHTEKNKFNPLPFPPKIRIVGSSGSGKSTLGKDIGKVLGIEHLEEDSVQFTNNFARLDDKVSQNIAFQFTKRNREKGYVTDGSWVNLHGIILPQCNVLIFLDYSFFISFFRLVRRTFFRCYYSVNLWGLSDCKESFGQVFQFNSDSVIFHYLKSYFRFKFYGISKHRSLVKSDWKENGFEKAAEVDDRDVWKGERIILHFTHPSEVELWLKSVQKNS